MAITLATKVKRRYSNDRLKEILKNMPMVQMRVGWPKDQYEENEYGKTNMRTAEVAYLNEVGHDIYTKDGRPVGYVVPRPLLGLSCETFSGHWRNAWRAYFRQYLAGEIRFLHDVAKKFCQLVIEEVRSLVESGNVFAPNKPSTQRKKKYLGHPNIPLIDYGTMIESLTHEIHIAR